MANADPSTSSTPPSNTTDTLLADLPETVRLLEEGIADGMQLGAQGYVSRRQADGSFTGLDLVVGDRAVDQSMTADTLNLWMSASKPITAVALAILWERDALGLDDPIARHVPEFAERGKDGITLRHALTHTGGFRLLNVGWPAATWDEIIANICKARPEPRWVPGQKAGYHLASSWFILGEVVRRVDGRHYSEFVRQEIFEPLGMDDCWVGVPVDRFEAYGDRIGRMFLTENGTPEPRRWHTERHVCGCSPGGNGYGPLRQLARFYEVLLDGGRFGVDADGTPRHVIRPQTVEALTTPHRVGLYDQTFKHKLDWGLGFIVNSEHYGAELPPYGYGRFASRRTFGHSGFQSSTAFADPEHGLVVTLMTNGTPGEPAHTQRFRDLTEAIYRDLGLATDPRGT